jgi:hypothetical protein
MWKNMFGFLIQRFGCTSCWLPCFLLQPLQDWRMFWMNTAAWQIAYNKVSLYESNFFSKGRESVLEEWMWRIVKSRVATRREYKIKAYGSTNRFHRKLAPNGHYILTKGNPCGLDQKCTFYILIVKEKRRGTGAIVQVQTDTWHIYSLDF